MTNDNKIFFAECNFAKFPPSYGEYRTFKEWINVELSSVISYALKRIKNEFSISFMDTKMYLIGNTITLKKLILRNTAEEIQTFLKNIDASQDIEIISSNQINMSCIYILIAPVNTESISAIDVLKRFIEENTACENKNNLLEVGSRYGYLKINLK